MTETVRAALSPAELESWRETGYLLQPSVLSDEQMEVIRREVALEFDTDSERRTLEDSGVVRGVHGSHLYRKFFGRLIRLPRLLRPARQLLDGDVYVHQFKINAKRAFKGEVWEWHQDFVFWHHEDGLPTPRSLSMALFLDDVTEFNGPLIFVPGGHRIGMVDVEAKGAGWANTLSADLKYTLDQDLMRSIVRQRGLVAPKAPRGSVLWFDCNIPHGSAPNMSPFDRGLLLISYNSVHNTPPAGSGNRPDWLSARDHTALADIGEDEVFGVLQKSGSGQA